MTKADYYKNNRNRLLEASKARYWANKEAICARSREYRKNNRDLLAKQEIATRLRHLAKYLLRGIRRRAKLKGLAFSITEKDISIPEVCPILGIPLAANFGGKRQSFNSPTIDRINPAHGYVPGNVAVISWKANWLKSFGTAEEHRKIANWTEDNCIPDDALAYSGDL